MLIIVLSSRNRIISTYEKYLKINNDANLTGKALAIISKEKLGLDELKFAISKNKLCDAYSPTHKVLIISEDVCDSPSLASITIVSHELGHAMQHKEETHLFFLSRLLSKLTRFTNKFIVPLLVIGMLIYIIQYPTPDLGMYLMITSGALFGLHFFNQLINIPLEYDASRRALKYLKENKFVSQKEYRKAKKLLNIAAQTYIAGLLDGLLILNKNKRKK
jgi:Zn-dependent membrane protease YugP